MKKSIFITGIDTDVGKTYITGLIGKYLLSQNKKVITFKLVQSGNENEISDDILIHRKIMNIPPLPVDIDKTTAPYIFKYPSSPHLAAKLEHRVIDINKIDENIAILQNQFEYTLIEGAGGVYVPITENYTILEYITDRNLETIIVSSSKLGSINHTLLTIDALKHRGIKIKGIVYNLHPKGSDIIEKDTLNILSKEKIPIVLAPKIEINSDINIDFSNINI